MGFTRAIGNFKLYFLMLYICGEYGERAVLKFCKQMGYEKGSLYSRSALRCGRDYQ